MYLFGRVFASGARLYMAAIAVAMILYGNIDADSVVIATLVLALAGLLYTFLGGIRSVIYRCTAKYLCQCSYCGYLVLAECYSG